MRLITFIFLSIISFSTIGQDCNFLPSDTTVCGFIHSFQITEEAGTFLYDCENEKLLSISAISSEVAQFSFSDCGEYMVIFESSVEDCKDTFRIKVNDPSNSVTTFQTDIGLGYGFLLSC